MVISGLERVWDDRFPCFIHDGRYRCGPEDGGDENEEGVVSNMPSDAHPVFLCSVEMSMDRWTGNGGVLPWSKALEKLAFVMMGLMREYGGFAYK